MNSSDSQSQSAPQPESNHEVETLAGETTSNSMVEYYQLKKSIFLVTVVLAIIISILVWVIYSLNIALSYFIGACVGVFYFRMLAKDVEKISGNNPRVGSGRLALFAVMVIIAAKWDQLQILPIILGFLTYKLAIIFYVLPSSLIAAQKSERAASSN